MASPELSQVTLLLKAWAGGDRAALDRLAPIVYDELRRISRRYMRSEHHGNTLQATALVNEAYLRLVDVHNVDWQHRGQFFAIAAQIMRRILVDAARVRGSRKRGDGARKLGLDETDISAPEADAWLIDLDAALDELAILAPRQAKVVELRYFAGFSVEEISELLSTSARTIERDWRFARAWLMSRISPPS